jgi:hypothetical protein
MIFSAIQSLDQLNEQILAFAFAPNTPNNSEYIQPLDKDLDARYQDAVKASLGLMRGLLLDAQVRVV